MADTKLSALTATTTLADTDLLYAVYDAAGTPVSRKIALSDLRTIATKWPSNFPDGTLINGYISPTVASNNLTLAIKTWAGNDPSATDPVYVVINHTLRSITAALSVTKAAGTNWCASGSVELGTKEIDYFAYLGYNATDGIVLGFSRIPYATLYSDFSATSTNEKYAGISTITNAAAGDAYVNIGRFAATLSAGAGYTWTVPTYTSANLVQRPIYETRRLSYTPTFTNLTIGNAVTIFSYWIIGRDCYVSDYIKFGTTSSMGSSPRISLPFSFASGLGLATPGIFLQEILYNDYGTAYILGAMTEGGANAIDLRVRDTGGTYQTMSALAATVPMTWTTNDEIQVKMIQFPLV